MKLENGKDRTDTRKFDQNFGFSLRKCVFIQNWMAKAKQVLKAN